MAPDGSSGGSSFWFAKCIWATLARPYQRGTYLAGERQPRSSSRGISLFAVGTALAEIDHVTVTERLF